MIIDIDRDANAAFFFTAGNLPTQKAYALTSNDVTDTFVVGLLRSQRLLCAASYFFETASTRLLVDQFPRLWRDQSGRAVFFVNEGYASFSDHGAGKLAKSPEIFSPYADRHLVTAHGRRLDDIGVIGRRRDVDISAAISQAWITSCLSQHQDSLGTLLRQRFPEQFEPATAACAELANRTKFDFIWETIEPTVLSHPQLSQVAGELRRRLADMYATVMSQTLSAIETSPSLSPDGRAVTARSTGHLGLFWDVLRRAGLDLREMRDEGKLLKVLDLEELSILRQMDELIVETAIQTNSEAGDYWRAVRITEDRLPAPDVTHRQIRRVLAQVFAALGLEPATAFLSQLAKLEIVFNKRLLPAFRHGIERQHDPTPRRPLVTAGAQVLKSTVPLLMCGADSGSPHSLSLEEELRAIREAIAANRDISRLHLDYLPNFRAHELQSELMRRPPAFLHFSGHGSETGHLETLSETGERYGALHSSTLADAIRLHCEDIQCVYLNACFSRAAIADLGLVAPYSVLVEGKVSNGLARTFAAAFYGAVDAGLDIPSAFDSAVNHTLTRQLDPAPVRLFKGTELIGTGEGKAQKAGIGSLIRFGSDPFR